MEKFGWEHKPHDTRKTAVSLMHKAGIPIETVRIIVGHSGKGVTEKVYLYKTPQELVDAINTIQITQKTV
jgi:integrase